MGLKSTLGKLYAKLIARSNKKWISNPLKAQKKRFSILNKNC